MLTVLAGGWGYENLGDEALLAGYRHYLESRCEFVVASRDPVRTLAAQKAGLVVRREGARPGSDVSGVVLGGGGYLNGAWLPEIYGKLWRLGRECGNVPTVAHSVEVRNLDRPVLRQLSGAVFSGGTTSVRDEASRRHAASLGLESTVLPDAISLLYPHVEKYITPVLEVRGKILLNLLDFGNRPDSNEALLSGVDWRSFCSELIVRLGDRALGLVGGEFDAKFMSTFPTLQYAVPRTVGELVSLISSSDGILSTRMHPGLIASILGKPVVNIPYCGKVIPTLGRLGLAGNVLTRLDVDLAMDALSSPIDHGHLWAESYAVNRAWLDSWVA